MKCGPDECPIVAFSDLTPAEQRVQRKRLGAKMLAEGFTEKQIAKHFGVSQPTISNDQSNLSETNKSKPAKTKSNPKGAGRPKGRKERQHKTDPDTKKQAAELFLDEGLSREKVKAQTGLGEHEVQLAVERERGRREAYAEPEIDRAALSMSAQRKLDVAIRQHQRKLDEAFENRVLEEINQRLDHIILPVWRRKIADAKKIYDVRRSITDKETFNLIVKCLHTDTRKHVSDEIANDAFARFMALEKYLLNEKASPTKFTGLPTTPAEWEQRKQEAAEIRRMKRGHSNVGKTR